MRRSSCLVNWPAKRCHGMRTVVSCGQVLVAIAASS
jgi:hypothetical protein